MAPFYGYSIGCYRSDSMLCFKLKSELKDLRLTFSKY